MQIPIVNEQDEIIGYKDRQDRNPEDIIRVSALWLKNTKGDVLLSQRALRTRHGPGKWGMAASGTVEQGESYEENMKKEALEEIGFVINEYIIGPKIKVHKGGYHYFLQTFISVTDWGIDHFTVDHHEVEQIKWFSKEELKEFLKNKEQITTGLGERSELFLSL